MRLHLFLQVYFDDMIRRDMDDLSIFRQELHFANRYTSVASPMIYSGFLSSLCFPLAPMAFHYPASLLPLAFGCSTLPPCSPPLPGADPLAPVASHCVLSPFLAYRYSQLFHVASHCFRWGLSASLCVHVVAIAFRSLLPISL